jgi:hypothetical protein
MRGREEFLEILEACERTSALLLLAMESGTPRPASLVALRNRQIEGLSATLPADMNADDLGRLRTLLNVGDQIRAHAAAAKLSATRNLASLCRGLQVARQMAPVRDPQKTEIDCLG